MPPPTVYIRPILPLPAKASRFGVEADSRGDTVLPTLPLAPSSTTMTIGSIIRKAWGLMLGIGRKRSPKRTSILFDSELNSPVQQPTQPRFLSQAYSTHLPAERALGQGRRLGRLGSRRYSPRGNIVHAPPGHQ